MKLSKQERIGLLIIIAVVILALGGFLIFKPKVESSIASKKAMQEKQKEFNEKNEEAAKMEPLKQQILEAYDRGSHMADMFFTEMKPYETDDMFREFLENRSYTKPGNNSPEKKAEVLIEELTISEPEVVELEPIFREASSTNYPLKEFATQGSSDVSPAAARNALLQAALGGTQQLSATTINLTISAISQDELIKFTDEINNFMRDEAGTATRKAMMASGIAITYPEVTTKYEDLVEELIEKAQEAGKTELEKNTGLRVKDQQTSTNVPTALPGTEEGEEAIVADYVHQWETTLTFYSIERMQDPAPILEAQDISVR